MSETVTISLEHYNSLRDFKLNVLAGYVPAVRTDRYFSYETMFFTEDESLNYLQDTVTNLNKDIGGLRNSRSELNDRISKLKDELVGVNKINQTPTPEKEEYSLFNIFNIWQIKISRKRKK